MQKTSTHNSVETSSRPSDQKSHAAASPSLQSVEVSSSDKPVVAEKFVILKTDETELVLDAAIGARPSILYWGPVLSSTNPEELALLSVRQWAHGGAAIDVPASLSNELGAGVPGPRGSSLIVIAPTGRLFLS